MEIHKVLELKQAATQRHTSKREESSVSDVTQRYQGQGKG